MRKLTIADADDINEFIRQLAAYAGRKLNYPIELGELLGIVEKSGATDDFEELIFQAKFLVKSKEIMRRIGPDTEGYERLSTEFQTSVEKAVDRLKLLVARASPEISQKHFSGFLSRETDGFDSFLNLASDFRWVKNWQLDGLPLPYDRKTHREPEQENAGEKEAKQKLLVRIRNSGGLAAILFSLSILIDPPVTILGWTLSIVIVLLLAYITLQLYMVIRIHHS
jgi:hypothetical protein